MCHDASGPHRHPERVAAPGTLIWDTNKVVLVIDHHVPEADAASRRMVRAARDWAREHALPHVYDSMGISHLVVPQHGHLQPGMFCVGADSRSCTGGAFGAYMFGVEPAELLAVLASGEIELQVPPTTFMRWSGRLADGVSAKDMMLATIGRYGLNGTPGHAVEYGGEAVAALPMAERMTLANMSAELGAQVGLVAPDEVTIEWLRRHGAADAAASGWHSDEDAPGVRHAFDASTLAPQVSLPDSPAHVRSVDDLERTPVAVAYIGACTGAKLDDLRAAARVLAGFHIAPGVQLFVAPASLKDAAAAQSEGILRCLVDAGATLLPSACGACAGHGNLMPQGANVISSSARNLESSLGSAGARVFLASPYTVAASALRGVIADAREVLA